MESFLQLLRERVGSQAFRIAKLYWLHDWSQARIAKHLRIHRGNVSRTITRIRRTAKSIASSLGDDFKFAF